MGPVKGNILDGDEVIFENVDVWVERIPGKRASDWGGKFIVPGINFPDTGTYRLVADDGREGRILITDTPSWSEQQDTTVFFKGDGPFERPQKLED